MRGAGGLLLRRKTEHGAEAHEPQNAQRVFLKPPLRLADAAKDACFQVFLPAAGVDERAVRRQSDGVDREVAAGKVLFNARAERDGIRVAVIPVRAVAAHRRELNGQSPAHDRHRAVLQARRVRPLAEEAQHLLRQGVGCHVVVGWRFASQHFAHAAANQVRRITRALQRGDDRFDFLR